MHVDSPTEQNEIEFQLNDIILCTGGNILSKGYFGNPNMLYVIQIYIFLCI